MEIIIRSKNVEVTDHIKDYADKKLSSAFRLIPQITKNEEKDTERTGRDVDRIVLEVELEKITGNEKGHIFRAEAQMKIPGKLIKAEDTAETLKTSIDEVSYELKRQLKDYKEKRETMRRKGGEEAKKERVI